MRVVQLFGVSIVFLLAPAIAAATDQPPRRKAGLWEIHNEMNGRASPVGPIQSCIDEKTDSIMQQGLSDAQSSCEQMSWVKDGDSYVIKSVCKIGKAFATTEGKFTGAFDSNYRGEMHTIYSPPIHGMAKSDITLTAKWLGPCKEGQKPGDIVMPNMPSVPGMPKSINIEEMMKMRDQMKRMQR